MPEFSGYWGSGGESRGPEAQTLGFSGDLGSQIPGSLADPCPHRPHRGGFLLGAALPLPPGVVAVGAGGAGRWEGTRSRWPLHGLPSTVSCTCGLWGAPALHCPVSMMPVWGEPGRLGAVPDRRPPPVPALACALTPRTCSTWTCGSGPHCGPVTPPVAPASAPSTVPLSSATTWWFMVSGASPPPRPGQGSAGTL